MPFKKRQKLRRKTKQRKIPAAREKRNLNCDERNILAQGLREFGSQNLSEIHEKYLTSVKLDVIRRHIFKVKLAHTYCHPPKEKRLAVRTLLKRQRAHDESLKGNLDMRLQKVMRRDFESPLEKWIILAENEGKSETKRAFLESVDLEAPNENVSGLPTLMRMIASTEYSKVNTNLSENQVCGSQVYASLYKAFAAWMVGEVPPALSTEAKMILREAIVQIISSLTPADSISSEAFPNSNDVLQIANYPGRNKLNKKQSQQKSNDSQCHTNISSVDELKPYLCNEVLDERLKLPFVNFFRLPQTAFMNKR